LRSSIFAALLHGTQMVGVSQLCGVQQRASPVFGRAAITLGIGPHSSFFWFCPSPTAKTPPRTLTQNTSKDADLRKDVPFILGPDFDSEVFGPKQL